MYFRGISIEIHNGIDKNQRWAESEKNVNRRWKKDGQKVDKMWKKQKMIYFNNFQYFMLIRVSNP